MTDEQQTNSKKQEESAVPPTPDFGDGAVRFLEAMTHLLSDEMTAQSTYRAPSEAQRPTQEETAVIRQTPLAVGKQAETDGTDLANSRADTAAHNAEPTSDNLPPSDTDTAMLDRISAALTARIIGDTNTGWEGVHL